MAKKEDLFDSLNFSSFAASLEAVKISFANFRTTLDGGMNFLRRRFSSGDLQGELRNDDELNFSRLNFTKKGPSPSAPSSPSKTQNTAGGIFSSFTSSTPSSQPQKPTYNKDRCKTLLIIDDQHTNWYVIQNVLCI